MASENQIMQLLAGVVAGDSQSMPWGGHTPTSRTTAAGLQKAPSSFPQRQKEHDLSASTCERVRRNDLWKNTIPQWVPEQRCNDIIAGTNNVATLKEWAGRHNTCSLRAGYFNQTLGERDN